MMKQTVCLLFVLALIAQTCAVPDDKADAETKAKEAAGKASAEGKDKADVAAADAKHAAKDAADTKEKAVGAATDAKDHAEKLAKSEHPDHAKDCHKPGAGGFLDHPASKVLKQVEETGKRVADKGVKVATDFLHLFGM